MMALTPTHTGKRLLGLLHVRTAGESYLVCSCAQEQDGLVEEYL